MSLNIPSKCKGCGKPLLMENLYVDDGCLCNSPRGTNFEPWPCCICGTDFCVKPGRRMSALYGDTYIRVADMLLLARVVDGAAPPPPKVVNRGIDLLIAD